MEEVMTVQFSVYYQSEKGGKWLNHGQIDINSKVYGAARQAFRKAFNTCIETEEMNWQMGVGVALMLTGGLFVVGSVLTLASCVMRGGSKWWVTVPVLAGCATGYGGVMVVCSVFLTVRPLLGGNGGDTYFNEEGKMAVTSLYDACGFGDIKHVAAAIHGGGKETCLPLWVIEKGK